MREQKPVAEAERRAGAEGREDFFVVLCEGGIGNQQQRHIALANDVVHLTKRAVRFREADFFGFFHRGRAGSKADFHPNVRAFQRLA